MLAEARTAERPQLIIRNPEFDTGQSQKGTLDVYARFFPEANRSYFIFWAAQLEWHSNWL
jgi:hypothetical protein